jgi:hypothetical protein
MDQCYNINVREKFHSKTCQNFLFQTGLLHHSGVAWHMVHRLRTEALTGAQKQFQK